MELTAPTTLVAADVGGYEDVTYRGQPGWKLVDNNDFAPRKFAWCALTRGSGPFDAYATRAMEFEYLGYSPGLDVFVMGYYSRERQSAVAVCATFRDLMYVVAPGLPVLNTGRVEGAVADSFLGYPNTFYDVLYEKLGPVISYDLIDLFTSSWPAPPSTTTICNYQ